GLPGLQLAPAFDPREQALDPRPVVLDQVIPAVLGPPGRRLLPAALPFGPDRDQVLGAGQDERVGVRVLDVTGESLVGLAGDGRNGHLPAQAERPVAGARVITEAQRRAEAGPPGAR